MQCTIACMGTSDQGISGFYVAANLLDLEAKQELRCKAWGGRLVLTPFICGSTWCVVDKAWISNKVAFKRKVLHSNAMKIPISGCCSWLLISIILCNSCINIEKRRGLCKGAVDGFLAKACLKPQHIAISWKWEALEYACLGWKMKRRFFCVCCLHHKDGAISSEIQDVVFAYVL